MYKLIKNSEMKKGFKIVLYILLTITCVYWLFFLIFKLLDFLRIILHNMTEVSHWWFFITLCVIFTIATLVLMELVTDVKPLTALQRFFIDTFDICKNWIISFFVR